MGFEAASVDLDRPSRDGRPRIGDRGEAGHALPLVVATDTTGRELDYIRQTMLDKRHGIDRENALVKAMPRFLTSRR